MVVDGEDTVGEDLGWALRNGRVWMERAFSLQSPDNAEASAVTVRGEWPFRDWRDDSVVLGTNS